MSNDAKESARASAALAASASAAAASAAADVYDDGDSDSDSDSEAAVTWYAFYSQDADREYYHEPRSGKSVWVMPDASHPLGGVVGVASSSSSASRGGLGRPRTRGGGVGRRRTRQARPPVVDPPVVVVSSLPSSPSSSQRRRPPPPQDAQEEPSKRRDVSSSSDSSSEDAARRRRATTVPADVMVATTDDRGGAVVATTRVADGGSSSEAPRGLFAATTTSTIKAFIAGATLLLLLLSGASFRCATVRRLSTVPSVDSSRDAPLDIISTETRRGDETMRRPRGDGGSIEAQGRTPRAEASADSTNVQPTYGDDSTQQLVNGAADAKPYDDDSQEDGCESMDERSIDPTYECEERSCRAVHGDDSARGGRGADEERTGNDVEDGTPSNDAPRTAQGSAHAGNVRSSKGETRSESQEEEEVATMRPRTCYVPFSYVASSMCRRMADRAPLFNLQGLVESMME